MSKRLTIKLFSVYFDNISKNLTDTVLHCLLIKHNLFLTILMVNIENDLTIFLCLLLPMTIRRTMV